MKNNNKLPVFYQNPDVQEDSKPEGKKFAKYNFLDIPFYQTKAYWPDIHYKPISKIWRLKDE